MIVSPSESPAARALGISTWKAEEWGVDFLWAARGRWFGVQRKSLKDLVASVEDGRLALERLQWPSVSGQVWVIIETGEKGGGAPREMPNTTLASLGTYGRPWTGPALRALTFSLMSDGVGIVWTKDEQETIERVQELHAWTLKDRHEAARGRPAAPRDVFGARDNRQYAIWFMTGLPGIGVEMAGRIFDAVGMPFRMTVGMEDLMRVKGVGKLTASKILEVFSDGG